MAFSVFCPECSSSLEVEDEHREWTVRCPHCRHEFRPMQAAAAPETFAVVEDDDEPSAPRRRRRRRDDEGDPAAGARDIATPGLVLEMIAWISLVLVICVSAFLIIAGIIQQGQPQQQRNEDPPEMLIFMGFCLGVFSVPYFAIIGVGARKMRNLTSYSWGVAAAVMAIASVVIFGVCGLPIIAPGIWVVVVLNRDDVKAAFKAKKKHERHYHDDDD